MYGPDYIDVLLNMGDECPVDAAVTRLNAVWMTFELDLASEADVKEAWDELLLAMESEGWEFEGESVTYEQWKEEKEAESDE